MPIRETPWPEGTPCWIDCQVDDVTTAREFYSALFGWEIFDSPEEAGGYLMALKEGRPVAGIGPKPAGMSLPSVWSTYLATDDCDASVEKATAAGGQFMMPPFDVMTLGRMTFGMDPTGAAYGLWQAKDHFGVAVYNEAGTVCWNELHTNDYAAAQQFYSAVFGWQYNEIGNGDDFVYSTIRRDGEDVGGMFQDTMKPAEVPNHWLTWFAVDDLDAAQTKAVELGSASLMGPHDSPFGRMAVVAAPQGEIFGLIDMSVRSQESPEG